MPINNGSRGNHKNNQPPTQRKKNMKISSEQENQVTDKIINGLRRCSNQIGGIELSDAILDFCTNPSQSKAAKVYTWHKQSTGGSLDEVLFHLFFHYGFRKSVYGGFSES